MMKVIVFIKFHTQSSLMTCIVLIHLPNVWWVANVHNIGFRQTVSDNLLGSYILNDDKTQSFFFAVREN